MVLHKHILTLILRGCEEVKVPLILKTVLDRLMALTNVILATVFDQMIDVHVARVILKFWCVSGNGGEIIIAEFNCLFKCAKLG